MHLPSAHTVLAARSVLIVAVIGLSALLSACGASDKDADANATAIVETAGAEELSITDPWVKATDESMTAAFGTLINDTDTEITVVGATSDVAGRVELHEVVSDGAGGMLMQPKEGGFTIPAGGAHELAAGGDHIMLMDLTRPLEAGEDVHVTLELSDGSTFEIHALVKPFAGADEDYADGHGDAEHGDHEHGDDEHPDDQ